MDFGTINPIALFAGLVIASTPLLFAAIGELVVEKSGVLNLGVEGMMIIGAVAGFAVAFNTGSPTAGFVCGALAGAVLSMIFGLLTQYLLSNQVATGLALTLFGLGFAALIGQPYSGVRPPDFPRLDIPVLSDLPVLGQALFSFDAMVYIGVALVAAVWYFLNHTRAGLILRAVGENHDAAHSLGYPVIGIRLAAIAFGGACAGIGGAYLSLVRVPQWTEGMTAGAGWIALAIVVFSAWRPWRVLIGAWLFGGVTILQLNLQASGFLTWLQSLGIPAQSQYLSMAPYLITILVLVLISADRTRVSLNAPASLGRVFARSG
jgi:simple sugar transport system permease protein